MKKPRKIVITFLILLTLIGSLLFKIYWNQKKSSHFSEPITRGTIIESVYGIGTVTAVKSFQFRVGISGTIQNLFVKEGDWVEQGQSLVSIGHIIFKAPFAGTITWLPYKIGENVFTQSVVYSLTDLQDRYLLVSLEQQGALRVRSGQRAKISFDSMRADSFEGVVESIYPNNSNFLVRIGIPNLPAQILPGMTADVAIGIQEHPNVLLIPVAAIHKGKVFVQTNEGKTKTVPIQLGIVDGAFAEIILGDLKEGERLSLEGAL